jgi:hypothetical protein
MEEIFERSHTIGFEKVSEWATLARKARMHLLQEY